MKTVLIEATTGEGGNWGKFLVGLPHEEWGLRTTLHADEEEMRMLLARGWSGKHVWVFDLQTGEGAFFRHGGKASADLEKTRLWVCPVFPLFLEWLYEQDISRLSTLPKVVTFPDAPAVLYGYRRPGRPKLESPDSQKPEDGGWSPQITAFT